LSTAKLFMIKRFFAQVIESISEEAAPAEDRDTALRLATAVLMIDIARADRVFDETEFDRLLQLIELHFDLEPEQAAALVNTANEKADDMVSLYEFTLVLHQRLNDREKARIVSLLWQIAYADGRLDKYEDALVLKISDLLHVRRGRVMRLKHDAQQAL